MCVLCVYVPSPPASADTAYPPRNRSTVALGRLPCTGDGRHQGHRPGHGTHELASLGATVFVSARTAADVDATVAALTSAHPHNPAHGFAADVGCAASLPSPLLTALLSTHLSAPQLLWLAAARSEPQRCIHPLSTLSRLPKRSERRPTAFSAFLTLQLPRPPCSTSEGREALMGAVGDAWGGLDCLVRPLKCPSRVQVPVTATSSCFHMHSEVAPDHTVATHLTSPLPLASGEQRRNQRAQINTGCHHGGVSRQNARQPPSCPSAHHQRVEAADGRCAGLAGHTRAYQWRCKSTPRGAQPCARLHGNLS